MKLDPAQQQKILFSIGVACGGAALIACVHSILLSRRLSAAAIAASNVVMDNAIAQRALVWEAVATQGTQGKAAGAPAPVPAGQPFEHVVPPPPAPAEMNGHETTVTANPAPRGGRARTTPQP